MRITIIGAGNIGGTLAERLSAAGHDVAIANSRGADSLRELAAATGATAVSLDTLPAIPDVVVIAVPPGALPSLSARLEQLPEPTVVVDTGNYVPGYRDESVDVIESGMPETVWSGGILGRPVVKAMNSIAAASLRSGGRPAGDPQRIALPVAGDRQADQRTVIELLDELGFDGFDAGRLEDSWRQQPGTPVYTQDLPLERALGAIGAASKQDTIAWRDRMARLATNVAAG